MSRAVALLRTLSERPDHPVRLATLSAATGLHKATAHRLLAALAAEGMVDVLGGGYALGSQAWMIGQAASGRFDLLPLAAPSLRRIADATGDVALLSIAVGHEARCIGREEGDFPTLPTSIRVGSVRPLGCTAHALALMAALPDPAVAEAVAATAAIRATAYPGITDAVLRARIAETRRTGVALAEGDIIAGQTALAVAIHDPWNRPIAALCCSAIAERLAPERRPAVVALLRAEAAGIENRLRPPSPAAPPAT